MENFTITSPDSLDAALTAAPQQPDAKFIAGDTDLLQLMKDEVQRPQRLVDLDGLPLDQFSIGDDGARIGALVKMSDLADNPDLRRHYPVIAEALLASASLQVRNMATIGGNLLQRTRCGYFRDTGVAACNKRRPGSGCSAILGFSRLHAVLGGSEFCIATHPSDLAVALAALDAAGEGQGSDGVRSVPINEFYLVPGDTPERETVLRPGDLITAILVPPPGMGERSHYLKLRDRASFEFALVSVAVAMAVDDGRLKVTGRPRYAAEFDIDNLAYAALVQSTIASGEITGFDLSEAQAVPGVLTIMTPDNAPRLPQAAPGQSETTGPLVAKPLLQDRLIYYNGPHIALAVADTP